MKTTLPEVRMGRFLLREICEEDYLDYYVVGRDYETTKDLSWGPFTSPTQALYVIQEIFLKRPYIGLPVGYAIIDTQEDDRMIGVIDYHTFFEPINSAEVGYILHRAYWNKGIMSRCLKEVIRIGFNHLELDKIVVGHVAVNDASRHVIEKCGFHYEYETMMQLKEKDYLVRYYSLFRYEFEGRNF